MLKRVKRKNTQTKKDRFQRWQNVSDIFKCLPLKQDPQHILIVDDVVTTGSTIESAVAAILLKSKAKISVATLARSG